MKKTAISLSILMSLFATAYASDTFSVHDDISGSYYIHLGPNGGNSDITMKSNPDKDGWYLDGAYASNGGYAHYMVSSEDNFATFASTLEAGDYHSFKYNSEADIVIYVYNSDNQLITTCPVNHAYFSNAGSGVHIVIAGDTQACANLHYYVQDDQGGNGRSDDLFAHQTTSLLDLPGFLAVKNTVSSSTIKLNNPQVKSNPDNDSWTIYNQSASDGNNAYYYIKSHDYYSKTLKDSNNNPYNSKAAISLSILNSQGMQLGKCSGSVLYDGATSKGELINGTCSNGYRLDSSYTTINSNSIFELNVYKPLL